MRRRSIGRVFVAVLLAAGCSNDGSWTFKEGAPADVGMDPAQLEQARTYVFAADMNTQAVVVARRGIIVAEWYADMRDETSMGASWSVAKSFTSALIGIALERGEIPSIDEPMTTYFPEWVGTERAAITLRNVLHMASGLQWNESYDPADLESSDIAQLVTTDEPSHVALVADNEVAHPPGTVFNYSSGDTMLLSRVLATATGMRAAEYAQLHLFEPMGLQSGAWWRDKQGDTLTYCCLDQTTRGFATFGQLYLQGGELGGEQIVPAAWVESSTTPSPAFDGYGLQWWLIGRTEAGLPADTYAALGHDGQFIYVVPGLELVVVRNGWYAPTRGEPVADPNLFVRYPSDNLLPGRGTRPPARWSHTEFLGPIVASIQ